MLVLTSLAMPQEFKDRLQFKNESTLDKPVYDKSILVVNVGVDEQLAIDPNRIEVIGALPFVNTKISNKSPHPGNRGNSFRPGVYYGFKRVFKAEKLWGHDAFYLNNDSIINDERVHRVNGNYVFDSKAEYFFVHPGKYRALKSDFFNPVNSGNFLSGVNIHKGPGANDSWNYSLGCVTVEPKTFAKFMKEINKNVLVPYIHEIDVLKHTYGSKDFNGFTSKDIDDIYSVCKATEFRRIK